MGSTRRGARAPVPPHVMAAERRFALTTRERFVALRSLHPCAGRASGVRRVCAGLAAPDAFWPRRVAEFYRTGVPLPAALALAAQLGADQVAHVLTVYGVAAADVTPPPTAPAAALVRVA